MILLSFDDPCNSFSKGSCVASDDQFKNKNIFDALLIPINLLLTFGEMKMMVI